MVIRTRLQNMRIKLQYARDSFDMPIPDEFYFEIQADGNYETLATSEIYSSKQAADHAIELIVGDRTDVVIDTTDLIR
jgi:hypothetical protein